MPDYLVPSEAEDGKLFKVRVLNTGEERTARYHHSTIGCVALSSPCFADPEWPDELIQRTSWLRGGRRHCPASS
jgi:hypothetical protein